MLQEFRVDNFKSLINIVFAPATTNLLLGMNNSGKTNLCEALRFMSFSSSFSLDLCAEGCGGRFGMSLMDLAGHKACNVVVVLTDADVNPWREVRRRGYPRTTGT